MPAAVAGPIIEAGVSGGFSALGANRAASASDRSARLQAEAAREALAYTKEKDAQERTDSMAAQRASYEQYSAREKRMTPYRAAGQGATQTIGHLLGLPQVDIPPPAPTPEYLNPPPTAASLMSAQPQLVTMRAPNGQVKQVPADQVAAYQAKGAVVHA